MAVARSHDTPQKKQRSWGIHHNVMSTAQMLKGSVPTDIACVMLRHGEHPGHS